MKARNQMLDVVLIDFVPGIWSRRWKRLLECRVEDSAFVLVTKQVPGFLSFLTQLMLLVIGQSLLPRVGSY